MGTGSSKKNDVQASILVLGLDNAGKTTILRTLTEEDISSISPTKGFIIKSLSRNGFNLKLLDVGGQKEIRPYWRNYFNSTDALIFVIDSTDTTRMLECGSELDFILGEERMKNVPLLVFANKQDLVGALSADQIAAELNLKSRRDRKWQIQACSAKMGDGLQNGMEWIMTQVK